MLPVFIVSSRRKRRGQSFRVQSRSTCFALGGSVAGLFVRNPSGFKKCAEFLDSFEREENFSFVRITFKPGNSSVGNGFTAISVVAVPNKSRLFLVRGLQALVPSGLLAGIHCNPSDFIFPLSIFA